MRALHDGFGLGKSPPPDFSRTRQFSCALPKIVACSLASVCFIVGLRRASSLVRAARHRRWGGAGPPPPCASPSSGRGAAWSACRPCRRGKACARSPDRHGRDRHGGGAWRGLAAGGLGGADRRASRPRGEWPRSRASGPSWRAHRRGPALRHRRGARESTRHRPATTGTRCARGSSSTRGPVRKICSGADGRRHREAAPGGAEGSGAAGHACRRAGGERPRRGGRAGVPQRPQQAA